MATVQAKMATEVALDLVQASTAIKNLTSAVSASTSAWRSQEAYLRSVGDYAGAARAKYDGLGEAMDAQRRKIEALQEKQRSMSSISTESATKYLNLKKQIDATRESMGQLDTTTDAGKAAQKSMQETIERLTSEQKKLNVGTVDSARQYLNFGRQIDQANAKLASMRAQQQRAAQQMDIEDSGVRRLSASMRAQQGLVSATVERLRSQGQAYQALETDLNGTRQRLASLQTLQQREIALLNQTRERFGENSDQYARQATRVQELGTRISETSNKVSELNERMRRTPSGWLGNVQQRLNGIQSGADRVSTSFGRIFGATAAANMFTGALGTIAGRMGDLTKAGIDYNVEQDKMQATWSTLTGSADKAKPMVNSINSMSKATGQSVDVVNELEQGFYHLNSSKKQADGMTSAMLNMGDAVGLTGDQLKAVEQDMVHGMATGKVTQGELNQIGMYFPMIDEAMAKHFKTSVAGMRQMAKAGKITSKDLQEVFEGLGNGKYKEATDRMMNSYFGMFRTIKSRTPQLIGDVTKPFMQISNPFIRSIKNWVNDSRTDDEFNKLGSQMAHSLNQVISAFGGSKVSATKVMDNAIRGLTSGVKQLGDVVANHHEQIKSFFSAFKAGSAAQAKLFAAVFVDLSKVMLPVLNLMARFPKTSAALVTGLLLASRAVRTLQAGINGIQTIKNVGDMVTDFARKVRGVPDKKATKFTADTDTANRQIETTQDKIKALPAGKTTELSVNNNDANRKLATTNRQVAEVTRPKRVTVTADTTNAQRNITSVKTEVNGVPKRVEIIGRANTTQAVSNITRMGSASRTAATVSQTSFGLIGRSAKIASTGLSLIGGPAGAIMLAVQGFQLIYQHNAKFRAFANGIASSAARIGHSLISGIGNGVTKSLSFVKNNWKEVGLYLVNPVAGALNSLYRHNARFRNWANGLVNTARRTFPRIGSYANSMRVTVTRHISNMMATAARNFRQGWNQNNRLTRQGVQQQIQQHRTMSTRVAVFNNQMWQRSQQSFMRGWNNLRNSTRNGTNNVTNEFNRMRITVGQRAQQAMDDASNRFTRGYRNITSNTSDWRGNMQNIWNDTRGKIGNIADNMRSDSTGKFSDMHSKLNDITNNGLSQMHDAWHDKLESIAEVVTNSGGHIHAQFVDLLDGLAKPFETLINGIINGVNWVLDHVGGDGKLGAWHFQGFANGTNGPIDKDQIALLNDAPGSNYQEMVHRKATGETFMLPAKRNMLFPLQQGDEVLDGERSHKLATMMQLPIPHAGGAIGNFFGGIFDKVGDAADDAMDWVDKALKNVVEFGTELFGHFVSSVAPKSTDSLNLGLKGNLPGFYARQLQAWMKKNLESMQDDNGDSITPEMIRKAAALVHEHVTDAEIRQIINVAEHESGNRSIGEQNNWDSNAAAGTPSKGVLQFIDPTFNTYAVKGHHNIWKAFDQVLAMLNDSNWRSDLHTGGWGPTGSPRGFADGGIATTPSIFGEAGAEMAIPLDTMKSTRAWQLMKQVVDYYAGSGPSNTTQAAPQTDLTPLEKRFDAALAQNQQLIGLIDKLIGVTDAVNNPTARYRRTQRDVNLANFQSFT